MVAAGAAASNAQFASLNLHPDLKKAVAELPFQTMTAIQQKCIPPLLFGQDVVGQAKTGSGKTLAFLIPAVNILLKHPVKGTGAVIIAPTKELIIQIHDVLAKLVKYTQLTYMVVTGGAKVKKEQELLQKGTDVVIGTPGRLLDHLLHCSGWRYKSLKCLIIDEADRLLADGFQRNMDDILQRLPDGRQTMMFSATNNAALQHLSRITFSTPPLFIVADEQKGYAERHLMMFNTPGDIFQSFGMPDFQPPAKKKQKVEKTNGTAQRIWKGDDDFLYDEDEVSARAAVPKKTKATKKDRKRKAQPIYAEVIEEEEEEDGDEVDEDAGEENGDDEGHIRQEEDEEEEEAEVTEDEEEDDNGGENQDDEAAEPEGNVPEVAPVHTSVSSMTSGDVEFPGLVDMVELAKQSAPTATNLTQYYVECEWEHRLMLLYCFMKYLRKQPQGTGKIIIFFNTVASVLYHQQMLTRLGIGKEMEHGILILSGKMKLRQRLATFRHFVACNQGILLATDVAARGLDIPQVEWIVQYDPPTDVNEYIHRVGRTARAGAFGAALLFLNPLEFPFLGYLQRFGIALLEYDTPFKVPNLQLKFEAITTEDQKLQTMGVKAFKAFVMSYQAHKLRDIFDINKLDMETVAISFALDHIPHVQIHRQEKKPYVKGVIKSMMRKKMKEEQWKSEGKALPEWDRRGNYIGRNPEKVLSKVGTKKIRP